MTDRDYVLGTEQDEIERLGLQHRVWRRRTLDAWRRAGIRPGQKLLDIGAGPGWATIDLAEIAGPHGEVIALERSARFLQSLRERAERHQLFNITALEQDICEGDWEDQEADAAWCRWVLSFVADPRRTVGKIARSLRPGGMAIFHEYLDYGAWQLMPPDERLERFRTLVMQSWRDTGGEPNIGLTLPSMLGQADMEIVSLRPIVEIARKRDFLWQWPAAFMRTGAYRLLELGYIAEADAKLFSRTLDDADEEAGMVTPIVLEVIARRL